MKYGVVYTLGYAGPGVRLLLDSWMSEPTTLLINIRRSPSSRWFPEWRGRALAGRYGSRYQHLPAFGNVNYRTPGIIGYPV